MDALGPLQNSLLATPSPRYVFDWRMVNDLGVNTACVDISGKGNNSVTFGTAGTPGAELTQPTCWANTGYLTMATRSNAIGDFASLPMAKLNELWNYLNGDSFLLFIRGKFTLPASDLPVCGSGVSNSRPGFKMTVRAAVSGGLPAGRIGCSFAPVTGSTVYLSDTYVPVASASPVDTSIALYVDGQVRQASIYVNGVKETKNEALALGDYRAVRDLVIGGCINFSNYDGISSQISEAQFLTWSAAAPANADRLVALLHSVPFHRLTAVECP